MIKILNSAGGKKRTFIRLSMNVSAKSLWVRREWSDIFKVLKKKNHQPRILYPSKLFFRYEGEIKLFQDKLKLRQFTTTIPVLQGIRILF